MKAIAKYLYSLKSELHFSTFNVVLHLNIQIIINVYQNFDILLAIEKFEVLKAMLLKIKAFFVAVIRNRCNDL